MNKLTLLGILFLTSSSFVFSEEYIASEYYEEIISKTEKELILDDKQSTEPNQINETEFFIDKNRTIIEEEEVSPYLKALESIKENSKVILLAIRATDCHYCDRMESETLSESSVKDALEKDFIVLHYNQDLEMLPMELQEGMTPNFVFVDKDENIINMYPGMRTPSEFKDALKEILSQ
ncbi:MAG: Unknown protein [uncultured Sulfurovum sp.]|uniref:Thioredoxin domain-containing protein n=1 Tax=uncultured Sulfurovum sp. TaxID=269237 RepID=A0A6S6T8N0_9BACT|nr:MAG: Unknown protein [uncultured Sulfurovum sp.]